MKLPTQRNYIIPPSYAHSHTTEKTVVNASVYRDTSEEYVFLHHLGFFVSLTRAADDTDSKSNSQNDKRIL